MRIAVLTLTRDRLDYTKHCFKSLRRNAGCEFDHFVLDQGSRDGTRDWLERELQKCRIEGLILKRENVGISVGMNHLLAEIDLMDYDVVVKFDNDCEVLMPDTLRDVAALADKGSCLLSPTILGLQQPPLPVGEFTIAGEEILDIPQIGGIFLAAPGWVYQFFRYDPRAPKWGTDDVFICAWFRQIGGRCGYVKRLSANHYETTDGQRVRFPDYFERKDQELGVQ